MDTFPSWYGSINIKYKRRSDFNYAVKVLESGSLNKYIVGIFLELLGLL